MMQQPGYPMQVMQGSPPPAYFQQAPGYGQQQPSQWQPSGMAQNQPAIQAGRSYQQQATPQYAQGDRLPAMPDMMRRPATPPPASAQLAQQQPRAIVRGAAPDLASAPPAPSSPGWTPVRIPTPEELGIAPVAARTVSLTKIAPPQRYDLGSVTTWLDEQGARSCQREKLPEGVQYMCSFGTGTSPITVRGTSEEEALQKLVQEVIRQRQLTLSQR